MDRLISLYKFPHENEYCAETSKIDPAFDIHNGTEFQIEHYEQDQASRKEQYGSNKRSLCLLVESNRKKCVNEICFNSWQRSIFDNDHMMIFLHGVDDMMKEWLFRCFGCRSVMWRWVWSYWIVVFVHDDFWSSMKSWCANDLKTLFQIVQFMSPLIVVGRLWWIYWTWTRFVYWWWRICCHRIWCCWRRRHWNCWRPTNTVWFVWAIFCTDRWIWLITRSANWLCRWLTG